VGVPVNVTVTAAGSRDSDELRSLRQWLVAEEELRGQVRLAAPDEPGSLGAVTDTLIVVLGQSGAAGVFAATLIAWIRHRTSDVRYKLTRPDGTVMEIAARRIHGLNAEGIQALTGELARSLDSSEENDRGDQPSCTP
jgi:Effector Associated Constant Component 1